MEKATDQTTVTEELHHPASPAPLENLMEHVIGITEELPSPALVKNAVITTQLPSPAPADMPTGQTTVTEELHHPTSAEAIDTTEHASPASIEKLTEHVICITEELPSPAPVKTTIITTQLPCPAPVDEATEQTNVTEELHHPAPTEAIITTEHSSPAPIEKLLEQPDAKPGTPGRVSFSSLCPLPQRIKTETRVRKKPPSYVLTSPEHFSYIAGSKKAKDKPKYTVNKRVARPKNKERKPGEMTAKDKK